MQDIDPFSPGHLGAALALAGLVVLMLDETRQPHALATAAACLLAALAAFAVDALRRLVRARRRAGRAEGRPRTAAPDSAAPATVTAGRWAMPPPQMDARVHPALSMPVERFRAAIPPAAGAGPAAPRAGGAMPGLNAGPDLRAAVQDTARRVALADMRGRRLGGLD